MQQQYELEYQRARILLLDTERNRRDVRRCTLFWSASQWEQRFDACIADEQRRDQILQQQIAAASAQSTQQCELLQLLYDAIEADIAWYRDLLRDLRATLQRWETDSSVQQERVDELLRHEHMVEHRLCERRIQLHQLSIELLERQRLVEGRLEPGVWAEFWICLQRAWSDQSLVYQRVYGSVLPASIRDGRLAWCQHIAVFHQTTLETWGRRRSFDRRELVANTTLLQAEIVKYSPKLIQRINWRRGLITTAVIAVLGLLLWFTDVGVSSGQLRRDQGTPAVTPTAHTMTDTFSQQPTAAMASDSFARKQSEQLNDQALALMIKGNCRDAIAIFQAAMEADPFFYEPPNNLAFCLFEEDNIEGAIVHWQRSLQLNDNNADGYAGLGIALHATGEEEDALSNYRHALHINPLYGNEHWLRTAAFWSERAIKTSDPLRRALQE